jgi:hypothetical protein
VYLPAESFQCKELYDNAGTPALRSAANANVEFEEIGSTGLSGFKVAGQAGASGVRHLITIPKEWDRTRGISVRTVWTHAISSGTVVGARDLVWDMEYGFLSVEASINGSTVYQHVLTATDVPNTAEDYPIQTSSAVDQPVANATADTHVAWDQGDIVYHFRINLSAVDASFVEDIWILGLEIEFSPNRGKGFVKKGRLP